jgi:hypothetical protein
MYSEAKRNDNEIQLVNRFKEIVKDQELDGIDSGDEEFQPSYTNDLIPRCATPLPQIPNEEEEEVEVHDTDGYTQDPPSLTQSSKWYSIRRVIILSIVFTVFLTVLFIASKTRRIRQALFPDDPPNNNTDITLFSSSSYLPPPLSSNSSS